MRKILVLVIAAAIAFILAFGQTVSAAEKKVSYYDERGNAIKAVGMYYNSDGVPMYSANCYYLDADGKHVYVGGCRAYYYDANGNLTAGQYYYDSNCKAVSRPTSYPGGYGCGSFYYNAQGKVVNATTYYDDFGNPVDPPVIQPVRGGCCGQR